MQATRDDLYARLDALGIGHRTVDHPPVFTVEEGEHLKRDLAGGHSKNLFVKDKKGTLFLIVALGETRIDLKALGPAIGAQGRLSFGRPELMEAVLGVTPGSVTPFALINDRDRRISRVILGQEMMVFNPVWFHPLENNASTAVSPEGLLRFIADCGHEAETVSLEKPLG
ncbi:prolyl-tRNA synthetase associated domain-containing protein [Aquisalinus flavus]|uniref:DNA-binding protein n=1 Tax=Aquisalinus flavus TaxID=1526572 RepID=A0A8J2Y461_9PROT|nr:prolyl-tRNA synthetase associated domain-containing protein [Aquisalinus flavus]MBD0425572.1 prolyl-tRNA synthetase associated domain-containing protein [Aquisalinus flavus]UNE48805.1 prolyl-tRNA synthetase associated domain-containing protein [Aquisalinus flavus]GGD14982.1 DNA-binding protein [Aquisalinus flavus]